MSPHIRERRLGVVDAEEERASTSAVEKLSRARLQWTWLTLIFSALQLGLGFLVGKILPFLVPQPTLPKNKNLYGKLSIVTGANSGVGYEIAKEQFLAGSHVVLACRNRERAEAAKARILDEVAAQSLSSMSGGISGDKRAILAQKERGQTGRLEVAIIDCSSLESVRSFASRWQASGREVDYLFLNAGIASIGNGTSHYTEEGFEFVYVTNHLGPFLLTGLLSPFLSADGRVILTSSAAAFFAGFSRNVKTQSQAKNTMESGFHFLSVLPRSGSFYGQSKAMQVVFANVLQRRFDQHNHRSKIAASYHPGTVATNIFTTINLANKISAIAPSVLNIIALTCKQGAQGALWLAQSDKGFLPGGFHERYHLITCPWFNYVSSNGIDEKMWKRWNADAGLQDSDWHY